MSYINGIKLFNYPESINSALPHPRDIKNDLSTPGLTIACSSSIPNGHKNLSVVHVYPNEVYQRKHKWRSQKICKNVHQDHSCYTS